MNQLISRYEDIGDVKLPEWKNRQMYMHSFDPEELTMLKDLRIM